MTEMVNAGNALSKALLQLLAPTLPGAHLGKNVPAINMYKLTHQLVQGCLILTSSLTTCSKTQKSFWRELPTSLAPSMHASLN